MDAKYPSSSPQDQAHQSLVMAALDRLTWRSVLYSQLLGVIIAGVRVFEHRGVDSTQVEYLVARVSVAPQPFPDARFIVAAIAAACLCLASAMANEAMQRGVRLVPAMLAAVPGAALATALLQWLVRSLLGGRYAIEPGQLVKSLAAVATDVGMLGALLMLAYLKIQTEQRLLLRVRQSELDRVDMEQRRVDYALLMMRAQVQPQWLLSELEAVRRSYASEMPEAEKRLENLIQALRRRVTPSPSATNSVAAL